MNHGIADNEKVHESTKTMSNIKVTGSVVGDTAAATPHTDTNTAGMNTTENHPQGGITTSNNNSSNVNIDCTALVLHRLVIQKQVDPPGEAPTNHPIVCTDLMIVPGGGSTSTSTSDGYSNSNSHYRSSGYQNTVLWMDPKNVHDPNLVDWNVLRRYDNLMSSSLHHHHQHHHHQHHHSPLQQQHYHHHHHHHHHQQQLLSNPRTRIATISTGFKAATYFVREDLDTRIYFAQLEDAIGYMGRRGYVKMRPEEEKEWRGILENAHKVVKVCSWMMCKIDAHNNNKHDRFLFPFILFVDTHFINIRTSFTI
jgi:hypothetical protein